MPKLTIGAYEPGNQNLIECILIVLYEGNRRNKAKREENNKDKDDIRWDDIKWPIRQRISRIWNITVLMRSLVARESLLKHRLYNTCFTLNASSSTEIFLWDWWRYHLPFIEGIVWGSRALKPLSFEFFKSF